MSSWSGELLFETDPITRSITTFTYNDNDTVTLRDQQDVTAIIEHNKAVANDPNFRPIRASELRRVATVPLNVLFDLKKKWREQGMGWDERQAAMKRFLNDSDNRLFRTDDTKI